ncbi:hypothetical protein LEP1GSC123_2404 [Leptospira borgpetersenii str. 200701203]|uniref:Uncharacterized protein n=1 Tax=Leptospira borgpetersenii str. 200701203 TaxID=1193007 RepID=M3GZZ5_LEPBO|nr:hypothetical protein LEP1GSC123_2404 [Leptospira borgpetersenii str. 200701203]
MILHIDTETGWRGGERQLLLLAEGLKKRKIPQLIVGKPGSALEGRCSDHGLSFQALNMRGEWDLASVKAIRAVVEEKKSNSSTHILQKRIHLPCSQNQNFLI